MSFGSTVIIGTDPRFQFVRGQHAVYFGHSPFAMHPLRLDWVQPRAFAGQIAERPGRMTNGEADQTVTLFFSLASAYSHGSEDGTENPQPSAPLTKITSATHS